VDHHLLGDHRLYSRGVPYPPGKKDALTAFDGVLPGTALSVSIGQTQSTRRYMCIPKGASWCLCRFRWCRCILIADSTAIIADMRQNLNAVHEMFAKISMRAYTVDGYRFSNWGLMVEDKNSSSWVASYCAVWDVR
jgi:hypothetical protein